ncbi:lipase family protein [Flavobacterium sp.]|uniref:lipase family protein n=1 Tax=Flavobacterium sp. TaxID=239 RepID=UPI00391B7123
MNEISSMKNDLNRYLELAKICKAVYGAPIRQDLITYNGKSMSRQKIVHGSYKRGFCRLFWNDETVIIAFRGTRESVDWSVSNLKMFPVSLQNCNLNSKKTRVHRGFQRTLYYKDKTTNLTSFDAIMKHINDLDLIANKQIIITGHSLGGALATLFSVKLRAKIPINIENQLKEIVLFGSPAVGLKNFKTFYGTLNSKTIRIINGSDVVPFTPPLFYYHIGNEIWLKKEAIKNNDSWITRLIYALKLPMKNFINDHSMKSYIISITESIKYKSL